MIKIKQIQETKRIYDLVFEKDEKGNTHSNFQITFTKVSDEWLITNSQTATYSQAELEAILKILRELNKK